MQKRRIRAPLTFSAERFSRACKVPEKYKLSDNMISFILKALYVFMLLAINMVLFATSGNMGIFSQNGMTFYEILLLLLFLAVFSVVIIGALYKFPTIQNIICTIITFWFITTLFNQFYQLDARSFLGNSLANILGSFTPKFMFSHSDVTIAVILSFIFICFIFFASFKVFAVYVLLFVIAFLGIVKNDFSTYKQEHDFIETYNYNYTDMEDTDSNNKFVYIMLPNFASYKYFNTDHNHFAKGTYDLMIGFLAKNNFEVYSNSYVKSSDQFMNVVQSVNTYSDKNPENHTLDTMMLSRYWKFFNINDEHIFLKDNQLFDSFKKAGYKISAYKSRGIDICNKDHMFNVDRCVEKINRPVNVYDSGISLMGRTQLLFAEWISSMNISNFAPIYKFLKIFSEPEKLPLVGINYNNLYVINSIKTFDVLAENIMQDKGRSAYFVYADIPSDMFIYDEFCNIKPRDKWINLENLPWIMDNKADVKYRSYVEQTRCLYGKLQQFIDTLDQDNLLDDTVLVINGISSDHNFGDTTSRSFVQGFIQDKMVALAIKSPTNSNFIINKKVCATKDIINQYLYNTNYCTDLSDIGISGAYRDKILNELEEKEINVDDIEHNIGFFDKWYKSWSMVNKSDVSVDVKKAKKSRSNVLEQPDNVMELMNSRFNQY